MLNGFVSDNCSVNLSASTNERLSEQMPHALPAGVHRVGLDTLPSKATAAGVRG